MIDTILLVPPDGDPHGLLADGVCGARPPTLVGYACNDVTHGRWWPENAEHEAPVCPECSARKRWCDATALVLAHGGKPVAEGCDRAWRALHSMCLARAKTTGGVTYCIHMRETYTTEWVEDVCAKWEREGARLVLLDADGRDVTP